MTEISDVEDYPRFYSLNPSRYELPVNRQRPFVGYSVMGQGARPDFYGCSNATERYGWLSVNHFTEESLLAAGYTRVFLSKEPSNDEDQR